MSMKLETPEFKNEQEESQWWVDNQELLLKKFEEAEKKGLLGRGRVARQGNTPTTTIRLDPSDISIARKQAEVRGLKYQTYLKMLIHEALNNEEKKSA
jgi:predicted DNA binding CopG/RHH family protein